MSIVVKYSNRLSRPYERRYVLVEKETGKLYDDAEGHGYRSPQKAYTALRYLQRKEQENAGKIDNTENNTRTKDEHSQPILKITLDEGAYPLKRAHETDAGLDIRSRESKRIPQYGCEIFHTGVHVELPPGTAGIIISKSGLNIKYGITSTGLIDEGYRGEIVVKLYNNHSIPYLVEKGDKISQLVIVPVMYATPVVVDKLSDAERGDAGFGSTGK